MMRSYVTFYVLTIMMHSFCTISTRDNSSEKTVLVFGGTGQIGIDFVHRLLQHNYKPILVSRGHWYYDSDTLIKTKVTHIPCDRYENTTGSKRENLLEHCPTLMLCIRETEHIDFVIDFTTYNQKVIRHAAEVLRGKVGLYIYISTHAVYELCEGAKGRPSKEEDCVRPKNEGERHMLTGLRSRADAKLQAEELLAEQRRLGGFPFTIFRLGDVMGPRCIRNKWWPLQLWIRYYHIIKMPIWVDKLYVHVNGSLVFTKDVSKAIHSAMEAGQIVHDQTYNIAFDRPFNLKNIVTAIAKELQVKGIKSKTSNQAHLHYPTVHTGPVDISKIKTHLDFQPTPWEDAVKDTIAWYENAYFDHPEFVTLLMDEYFAKIIPKEIQKAVYRAIYKQHRQEEL